MTQIEASHQTYHCLHANWYFQCGSGATTLERLVDAIRMTGLPNECRHCVGGSGGDGARLYDDHRNRHARFQGLQNLHHICLRREAQSLSHPWKGHARMTSKDCTDFQVHSTGDILLQEYPNVCRQSQQQIPVIDFFDREELCSTVGLFGCCGYCVGFGD